MIKVFIDSSVMISAAISKTGASRELLVQGFQGKYYLSASSLVFEETMHNVVDHAVAAMPALKELRGKLPLKIVKPSKGKILMVAKFIEWKDAPIVAGALAAKADYLVTLDKQHLLSQNDLIQEKFNLTVISPGDFLHRAKLA